MVNNGLYNQLAVHSREMLKIRSMISPDSLAVKQAIQRQILTFAEALMEYALDNPAVYTAFCHGPILGIALDDEMNTVITVNRDDNTSVIVHTSLYKYQCEASEQFMFVHDTLTSIYRNLKEAI